MKLTNLSSFKEKHLQPLRRFHQNVNLCERGEGDSSQYERLPIHFWKDYLIKKKQEYVNEQELWLKGGKDKEQPGKTITE